MGDLDHARMLILMAEKDLKALIGMIAGEPFDDEVFGLHIQQSVEKALKSWLALLGVEYPKTHDITLLLSILEKQGVDVDSYWTLEQFNAFAVQYRYEAYTVTGGVLDRHDLVEQVSGLVKTVQDLIDVAG
jgi:HEPN domain-containing protein